MIRKSKNESRNTGPGTGNKRIWEIDFFRAVAIILMVIFHTAYDLYFFTPVNIDITSGMWYWTGKTSALLFIFISGISSGFSRNSVKRGLRVLGAGMLVTAATWIFFRESYVRFGILHFLGVCMILFPVMKKANNILLLAVSVITALAAIPLRRISAGSALLLPFGVRYEGFSSLDYYPLCPYMAVFILGVIAYKLYYYKRKSLFGFSYENRVILFLSRHSLLIYLLHQPVILPIVLLFNALIK